MDNIDQLQRRKMELKAQIEQQRTELKKTFVEIRQDIEPANLLKMTINGFLKGGRKPSNNAPSGDIALPPLSFLTDLVLKDPKWSLVFKFLVPIALKYLPMLKIPKKGGAEILPAVPTKVKMYNQFRRGIVAIRKGLRKTNKEDEKILKQTEK